MSLSPGSSRAVFDPDSSEYQPISRSKLELFLDCPRCFYLDRRFGLRRVDGYTFTLNLAVDALLKKEMDMYRSRGEPHPFAQTCGLDARPLQHPLLATWRDAPQGIRHRHHASRLEVFGLVDDIWENVAGEWIVVDYKAVGFVPPDPLESYVRQIDLYRWLFLKQGFPVAEKGLLLYAVAQRTAAQFNRALHFTYAYHEVGADLSWIEDSLLAVRECLDADRPPPSTSSCVWCAYRRDAESYDI